MPYWLGASSPVTIATTPSSALARDVSMRLMRACGYGECRILPTSIPGRLRSSVYLPAPLVLPAASTIAIDLPITEKSLITVWLPRVLACLLCARHRLLHESPDTSANIPYNDTDCCSAPHESLRQSVRGYWPAA